MNDENRLRQADWRFLLPVSEPHTVLAVPGGRLAAIPPTLGVAVVTRPRPDCDLALATDPKRGALEMAFRSLRPGGACYVEWRSPLAGGPGLVRRRLEATGFADIRLYWAWPWATPSLWVPLDAPAAAFWTIRQRRGRAALAAWRVAHGAGMLRPLCATAIRPPLDDNRGPRGVPLPELGGRPVWTLIAPGTHSINKLVALVAVPDRPDPVLALKLPRVPPAAAALEREAANLRDLAAAAEGSLTGVPRLLFEHREGADLRAIAESALHGVPLYRELEPARHAQLATQATDWLVKLGRLSPPLSRKPEGPLELLADVETLVTSRADRDLLAAARPLVASAEGVRRVFEQRDFSPWNVHIGPDGGLVVYDWESAEPAGFPALDLVYFLAYAAFFLDGAMESGRFREAYRAVFSSATLGTRCLERYSDALSIPRDRIPALRALTWIVHARSMLRREHTGPAEALFLELLRHELASGGAFAGGG